MHQSKTEIVLIQTQHDSDRRLGSEYPQLHFGPKANHPKKQALFFNHMPPVTVQATVENGLADPRQFAQAGKHRRQILALV
ncbi:MAG: hypothetical protein ACAF41_11960 [Leptolyngbya sp. BL-A-14]